MESAILSLLERSIPENILSYITHMGEILSERQNCPEKHDNADHLLSIVLRL